MSVLLFALDLIVNCQIPFSHQLLKSRSQTDLFLIKSVCRDNRYWNKITKTKTWSKKCVKKKKSKKENHLFNKQLKLGTWFRCPPICIQCHSRPSGGRWMEPEDKARPTGDLCPAVWQQRADLQKTLTGILVILGTCACTTESKFVEGYKWRTQQYSDACLSRKPKLSLLSTRSKY